ncbi:hypothetical protein KR222_005019 [Zaprionus bogoriensis]|nr:hypothetical protein KR222_005019 [Zaprionus bogoriensis]
MLLLPLLLSAITMSPVAGITAPLPLPLELLPQHPQQQHTRSNYYEPHTDTDTEALPGLAAGYTQHYYGATSAAAAAAAAAARQPLDDDVGDLAAVPYANYEPKAVSASGFVPTSSEQSRLQSLYGGAQRGKIDFVINTANYELAGNGDAEAQGQQPPLPPPSPAVYYQSYGYQPQAVVPELPPPPQLPPLFDYPIEQFSNYRPRAVREQRAEQQAAQQPKVASQPRLATNEDSSMLYASSLQRATLALPQQHPQQTRQDQQLAGRQLVDLPGSESAAGVAVAHNALLPPVTTSVHHTPSSSKALAGLPLAKHIEVTRHVPVTHYQQQHVPYRQTVQLRVPRPVIATIPKPIPIRVPVSKTIAVPQLQEVKIPVEQVKPVAVERPVPFVVERRVPYRVEKPIATPIYYPYPIKVPIVRTVVHKQRPLGTGHWAPLNHLLG